MTTHELSSRRADTLEAAEVVKRLRERVAAYTSRPASPLPVYAAHLEGARNELREAADVIASLSSQVEGLKVERDEAVKALEDGLEPRIKRMTFEDGNFDAELTGESVNLLALAFVSHFKQMGTENYMELNLHDRANPFQRYTVTVQKVGKLSPADKANAAIARAEKAEAALASQAIPEGFVLAPKKPTEVMRAAGQWTISPNLTVSECVANNKMADRVYRAMLAAIPAAPEVNK